MKKQFIFLALILPAVVMLSGCETTSPTQEATAEHVVAAAPAVSQPAVVTEPKIEAKAPAMQPEHCLKHEQASGHVCKNHPGKHKGKKGKACIKHCEQKATTEHDCVKHCADEKMPMTGQKCDKHDHK